MFLRVHLQKQAVPILLPSNTQKRGLTPGSCNHGEDHTPEGLRGGSPVSRQFTHLEEANAAFPSIFECASNYPPTNMDNGSHQKAPSVRVTSRIPNIAGPLRIFTGNAFDPSSSGARLKIRIHACVSVCGVCVWIPLL